MKKQIKISHVLHAGKTSLLVVALIAALVPVAAAQAALSSTSLSLNDPRPDQNGIQYTLTSSGFNTSTAIGCIEVDMGSAADGSGDVTDLVTTNSTLVSQDVTSGGGWSVSNAGEASQQLRITHTSTATPQSGSRSVVWGAIDNGSVAGTGYYAKITTYATNSCTTPVDTQTVQFIYTNGQAVTASVDSTLSFAVAGTSSGTSCNGATSNITTTSTTVPFGTVTTGTNKVGVQNLTVTTNAGSGYTVSAKYTGQLASGSNTIANHSGTNSSPTAFPSAGTAAYGYTTNDSSLGTGTANRFTSTPNVWAGFSTSNAEVAYSSSAVSSQTTCVGQQVGISGTTPAGSYSTTVVYTATPVY